MVSHPPAHIAGGSATHSSEPPSNAAMRPGDSGSLPAAYSPSAVATTTVQSGPSSTQHRDGPPPAAAEARPRRLSCMTSAAQTLATALVAFVAWQLLAHLGMAAPTTDPETDTGASLASSRHTASALGVAAALLLLSSGASTLRGAVSSWTRSTSPTVGSPSAPPPSGSADTATGVAPGGFSTGNGTQQAPSVAGPAPMAWDGARPPAMPGATTTHLPEHDVHQRRSLPANIRVWESLQWAHRDHVGLQRVHLHLRRDLHGNWRTSCAPIGSRYATRRADAPLRPAGPATGSVTTGRQQAGEPRAPAPTPGACGRPRAAVGAPGGTRCHTRWPPACSAASTTAAAGTHPSCDTEGAVQAQPPRAHHPTPTSAQASQGLDAARPGRAPPEPTTAHPGSRPPSDASCRRPPLAPRHAVHHR